MARLRGVRERVEVTYFKSLNDNKNLPAGDTWWDRLIYGSDPVWAGRWDANFSDDRIPSDTTFTPRALSLHFSLVEKEDMQRDYVLQTVFFGMEMELLGGERSLWTGPSKDVRLAEGCPRISILRLHTWREKQPYVPARAYLRTTLRLTPEACAALEPYRQRCHMRVVLDGMETRDVA